MNLSIKKQEMISKFSPNDKAQNFIAAGVACYAFFFLDHVGLLELLASLQGLCLDSIRSHSNALAMRAAIQTLECNGVVFFEKDVFRLTIFGKSLVEHRGSIGLIYGGYASVLANQHMICRNGPFKDYSLLNDKAISRAASQMGDEFFNHRLLDILKSRAGRGTICDLGCGNASTLKVLCRGTGMAGIGFDFSATSIEIAKETLALEDKITLEAKDITTSSTVYCEVEALLQSFVMHDFTDQLCFKMLRSLKECFPNVKMFLYVDVVSPEGGELLQLPGFDYVHSLFGIQPRTLSETRSLFSNSGFDVIAEESIEGLTNCYIWTLCPLKFKESEL